MDPFRKDHLAELDGLRGVAIALVMLGHFTFLDGSRPFDLPFTALQAFGWIGVDLFFVLSGFLITGILLDGRRDPKGLRSFYGRRAIRILPVYYGLLALYTLVFPALFPKGTALSPPVLVSDPIWYWTFLSNFLCVGLGHFPPEVLAVAWSLAVEEQFYLIWPWFVRSGGDRALEQVAVGAFFLSIALKAALLLQGWSGHQVYVFTPTRLEALAAGAIVALWRRTPEGLERLRAWRVTAAKLGVICLTVCLTADAWIVWSDESDRWLSVLSFPTLAVGFAAVLSWAIDEAPATAWLRSPVLGWLGRVSFPMYLLNNTLGVLATRLGFDPNQMGGALRIPSQLAFYLALFTLSALLGTALHLAVERPFQRCKRLFPRTAVRWRPSAAPLPFSEAA